MPMTLLRTRHSLEFDLLSSPLRQDLFPYTEAYEDYKDKRGDLGKLVGTIKFIWCIPASCFFKYYEMIKPVEWVIQVSNSRIRGFVHSQKWFDYLEGKKQSLEGVYFPDSPPKNEYSVIVDYPLQKEEVKEIRIFRFIDPQNADILCEKRF